MSPDEQKARVQHVLDAFAAGKMDEVKIWFADDLVVHEAPSLPYGDTHYGLSAFTSMLTALADNYDVVVNAHTLASSEDGVVLHQDMTFTSKKIGRSASLPGVEIWRFAGDKISDIDIYYKDTKAMVDLLTPM